MGTKGSKLVCRAAVLTALAVLIAPLAFARPEPPLGSRQAVPRAAQMDGPVGVDSLGRLVHYDDLRALRSFFERVDVTATDRGLTAPSRVGVAAIAAVLEGLGDDWQAPFRFVQGAVVHTPYRGSVRGPAGALESGFANSVDQALLLIALLNARGVEARLVRGRLEWSDAALLAVGSRSPAAPEAEDPWPRWLEGAADHWWVQAVRDGEWLDLDPTFLETDVGEAVGSGALPFAELPAEWRTTVRVELRRGDSVLAGALFDSAEIVGETVRLDFESRSAEAIRVFRMAERQLGEVARILNSVARVFIGSPALPAAAIDGRASAIDRILLDSTAGPWMARLGVPGQVLTAGPFDASDLEALQLRVAVEAPFAPVQTLDAGWTGDADGQLAVVVAAGRVPDSRLAALARPFYQELTRIAAVERAARGAMRPPIDYFLAASTLEGAANAAWEAFGRTAPEALGWAVLQGIDRLSPQSAAGRVVRQGLRLAAVRWQPPAAGHAAALEIIVDDPVTIGQLTGVAPAASLRAAHGLLQSAVLSQILNRLTERAPDTAFDMTLRAIGTGRPMMIFRDVDGLPRAWPVPVRGQAAVSLRGGYAILAPGVFEEGKAGWWQVGVADGATIGWVSSGQVAVQGRVEVGAAGRLDDLATLLASLPALHRASRWLAGLTGEGPAALASVPIAACASAAVAADILGGNVPESWPKPDVLALCVPG